MKNYLDKINAAIAAINYPARPADLYEPIAYTMNLGGKRLRPRLVLMTCEALGGDVDQALLPAVGLELFHNFTLLHDDVMDRADVRRGKPTVHCRWNDNVAILSGDAMLTMATQYIAKAPARHAAVVMDLYNRTAMEIYEGQQWDMDFEHRSDVSADQYLEMIRLKTSVLLGCACKMGAILADAPAVVTDKFYRVGEQLGLMFQMQDDLLDVWGDAVTFGKEIGGDIMNNKKTFLLIDAMAQATGDDALELNRWLHDSEALRDMKVPAVTAIYERLGLREQLEARMNTLAGEVKTLLDEIAMSDEARSAFISLVDNLLHRNK